MEIDYEHLQEVLSNTLASMAPWVEERCGRVKVEQKEASAEPTDIHVAVTEVDRTLQDRILENVLAAFPDFKPLAEEDTPKLREYSQREGPGLILDPVDGTASYIKGRKDYTTLAALLEDGRLTFGMIATWHPLEVHFSAPVRDSSAPETSCIAAHYRLFRPEHEDVLNRLRNGGYSVLPTPLPGEMPASSCEDWRKGPALGSGGSVFLSMMAGHLDAYLGPWTTLHDLAAPWALGERAGAACLLLDPSGWEPLPEAEFHGGNPIEYFKSPPRYRILMARSKRRANRVLSLCNGV
jgi:fructose-1,6-bisphosphatase/inositol monophosphatase family enzyme